MVGTGVGKSPGRGPVVGAGLGNRGGSGVEPPEGAGVEPPDGTGVEPPDGTGVEPPEGAGDGARVAGPKVTVVPDDPGPEPWGEFGAGGTGAVVEG